MLRTEIIIVDALERDLPTSQSHTSANAVAVGEFGLKYLRIQCRDLAVQKIPYLNVAFVWDFYRAF